MKLFIKKNHDESSNKEEGVIKNKKIKNRIHTTVISFLFSETLALLLLTGKKFFLFQQQYTHMKYNLLA